MANNDAIFGYVRISLDGLTNRMAPGALDTTSIVGTPVLDELGNEIGTVASVDRDRASVMITKPHLLELKMRSMSVSVESNTDELCETIKHSKEKSKKW